MTQLRDLLDFATLWSRRTVIGDDAGMAFDLLNVPDLVQAKKTQRGRDWPVIDALVAIHYRENAETSTPEHIAFWLAEARSPELLVELTARFPAEAKEGQVARPLADFRRAEREGT